MVFVKMDNMLLLFNCSSNILVVNTGLALHRSLICMQSVNVHSIYTDLVIFKVRQLGCAEMDQDQSLGSMLVF